MKNTLKPNLPQGEISKADLKIPTGRDSFFVCVSFLFVCLGVLGGFFVSICFVFSLIVNVKLFLLQNRNFYVAKPETSGYS